MVTNKPSWEHLLLLACFASSPLATACIEPTVIGGGDGTGGSGASGGPGGSSVGGGPQTTNAVAMFWDEVPFDDPGSGTSTGVGGGGGVDPDTLFLTISSLPVTCADPFTIGTAEGCETGWHLSVNLPPAYQTPGVYSLEDPAINALVSEELDDGSGVCSGGGGWYLQGTFEVVSIDGDGLVVAVTALNQSNLDGTYDVPRCTPIPDEPNDGTSIAIRADQFPPIGSGSGGTTTATSSGSGGVDPATLYVMIANHAISCGDPYGTSEDCPAPEWLVSVGLPVAYQTPGVYSLSDPNVIAYTSESGPNGDGTCWGGGGSFLDGTIEVVAIDQTSITVKFDGVGDHGAELSVQQVVPRCP